MRRAVLMTRQAISPRLAIRIFLNIIGLSSDHATLAMARFLWYIDRVIVSFANRATERFAREGKAKFAGLDAGKAMARLQLLHAAESLNGIPPLKSVGLHALAGDRQGQWAMTINGPWRLVFRFRGGNAEDVEIVDYH